MMAGFDHHSVCARCRDKKKGSDPCIKTPPEACEHCDLLSPEQKIQLSTPYYKLKKERKDAKSTPRKETDTLTLTLVDPALVSVVGVVDSQNTSGDSALSEPVEKKKKCDTKHSSKSTKAEKSAKKSSSDASRARDTRYLASFSTSPQFGIFGAFGRIRDPACLQNGGAQIVSRKFFNFIIMKAIFGRFFFS